MILRAIKESPSASRKYDSKTLADQLQQLPSCLASRFVSSWLVQQVADQPGVFRAALLEVVEGYYSRPGPPGKSFEARLAALGVRFERSNHEQLEAERLKRLYAGT